MAISTSWEVKENSGEDISECDIAYVDTLEYELFETHFGISFYEKLESEIVDYSIHVDYQGKWVKGTNYTTGQFVSHLNFVWKAKVDTANEPKISTDWETAEKFETPCYNDLWCKGGYKELSSMWILKGNMPFIRAKLKSAGHVELTGRYYKQSSDKTFDYRLRQQDDLIATQLKIVDAWINANNGTKCFDLYKGIKTEESTSTNILTDCCTTTAEETTDSGIWTV